MVETKEIFQEKRRFLQYIVPNFKKYFELKILLSTSVKQLRLVSC